jgi:hypothetical protein
MEIYVIYTIYVCVILAIIAIASGILHMIKHNGETYCKLCKKYKQNNTIIKEVEICHDCLRNLKESIKNGNIKKRQILTSPWARVTPNKLFVLSTTQPKQRPTMKTKMRSATD